MKRAFLLFITSLIIIGCATFPEDDTYFPKYSFSKVDENNLSVSYSLDINNLFYSTDWRISEAEASNVIEEKFYQSSLFEKILQTNQEEEINLKFKIKLTPADNETMASVISGTFLTVIPVWSTHNFFLDVVVSRAGLTKQYQFRDAATQVMWLPMVILMPFSSQTQAIKDILDRNLDKLLDDMIDDGFFDSAQEINKKVKNQEKSSAGDIVIGKEKSEKDMSMVSEELEPRFSGTGFFVNGNGYLITNNHVVEDANKIKIYYGDDLINGEIVAVDKHNDIALLRIDTRTPDYLLFADISCKTGEDVFTIGFPNIDLQGLEPKYTKGYISSLSGFENDYRLYQISVPIQPGNSGGPLLNENGKIVGIVTSSLSSLYTFLNSGTIPQNVNYAIKGSYIKPFLENFIEIPPEIQNNNNSIGHAKKSVALIYVY